MTADLHDQPHPSGNDRFAIYQVVGRGKQERLCETSREGIGLAIQTMLDEEQIERGARVGVLDRLTRAWLVNPYA